MINDFSKKTNSILISSGSAFLQIGCAYVFGAILDAGIEKYLAWPLAIFGMVMGSVLLCFCASGLAKNKDGYCVGKFTIPASYWYLYALLLACFLSFVLFSLLSMFKGINLFTSVSFIAFMLPILISIMDGFAFFAARAGFFRKNEDH